MVFFILKKKKSILNFFLLFHFELGMKILKTDSNGGEGDSN